MEKDYFVNRVSVRNFGVRHIEMEKLTDIIERAMRAPTCGNMQLYSVVVTRDDEMKTKLSAMHFNQPASTGCDVILTICADFNRFTRWCELSNAVPGYDNFHSFVSALTDAVIFAQQIVTIAEMEGLGTCYLGTVNYNAADISALLELPDLVVPVASLAVGYPIGTDQQVERLPVAAVVHLEKYRKDSDEELLALFKDKEECDANKKFVKDNGKQSLASVFTDIRYPKAMNEKVSKDFLKLLESKKFL
ncbi:MAG: nitroreductase family protein [Muribaculaceae bacterium]|nr:nitroreductase family protein [Muribaculaceae bacterium]